jgi:hypothetical protein
MCVNEYVLERVLYDIESKERLVKLCALTINDNHRLITLDIQNLYVNIPIEKTIHTTRT